MTCVGKHFKSDQLTCGKALQVQLTVEEAVATLSQFPHLKTCMRRACFASEDIDFSPLKGAYYTQKILCQDQVSPFWIVVDDITFHQFQSEHKPWST